MALGVPNQKHDVKPRLPLEHVVFEEEYQEQSTEAIEAYDRTQTEYAGACDYHLSQRLAEQFGNQNQARLEKILSRRSCVGSEKLWPYQLLPL